MADIFDLLQSAGEPKDIFDEVSTEAPEKPPKGFSERYLEALQTGSTGERLANALLSPAALALGVRAPDLARGALRTLESVAAGPAVAARTLVDIGLGANPMSPTAAAARELPENRLVQEKVGGLLAEPFETAADVYRQEAQDLPRAPGLDRSLWQARTPQEFAQLAAVGAVENLPQLAGSMAATALLGPEAGLALMGGMEAGGAYQDLRTAGAQDSDAAQAAAGIGLINSVLERYGASKALESLVGANAAKSLTARLLTAPLAEGATEVSQEWPQILAERALHLRQQPVSWWQDVLRSLESGAYGALLGAGAAGTGLATYSPTANTPETPPVPSAGVAEERVQQPTPPPSAASSAEPSPPSSPDLAQEEGPLEDTGEIPFRVAPPSGIPVEPEGAVQPPPHVARAIAEPHPVPPSVAQQTKALTKDTLKAALDQGLVPPGTPVRLTTVAELHELLRLGRLSEGRDFEGRPGISAQLLEPQRPIVAYGDNRQISAAIVLPQEAVVGSGEAPGEVKIHPDTDLRQARFVIDGYPRLMSWEELRRAAQQPESGGGVATGPEPSAAQPLPKQARTGISRGMSAKGVQRVVDRILPAMRAVKPDFVEVVQDASETPELARLGTPAHGIQGFYSAERGKVVLVASQIRNGKEAVAVLLHELVGHVGLEAALGDRYAALMDDIWAGRSGEILRDLHRWGYAGQHPVHAPGERGIRARRLAVEEWLSHWAESPDNTHLPILKRLYAELRLALRRMGIRVRWTDDDLRVLLVRSRRRVEAPTPLSPSRAPAPQAAPPPQHPEELRYRVPPPEDGVLSSPDPLIPDTRPRELLARLREALRPPHRSQDIGPKLPVHAPRVEESLQILARMTTLASHWAKRYPHIVKPFFDAARLGKWEKYANSLDFAESMRPMLELKPDEAERVAAVAYMLEGNEHVPEGDPAVYQKEFGLSAREAEALAASDRTHEMIRQRIVRVFIERFRKSLRTLGLLPQQQEQLIQELLAVPGLDFEKVLSAVERYVPNLKKEIHFFRSQRAAKVWVERMREKGYPYSRIHRAERAEVPGRIAVTTWTDPILGAAIGFRVAIDPWLGRIRHYQPHTRYGPYTLAVWSKEASEGDPPLFFATAETPAEFHRLKRELEAGKIPLLEGERYDPERHTLHEGFKAKQLYENRMQIQMRMVEAFLRNLPADEEVKQLIQHRIFDYTRAKGFGAHFIRREAGSTGIPGFSRDIVRTNADTIAAAAGFLGKVAMADAFADAQEQTSEFFSADTHPQLFKFLADYQTYNLDSHLDPWARVRALNFFWQLGGVLKTAAVNLTQQATLGWPELAKISRRPLHELSRASRDWLRWKRGEKLGARDEAALNWALRTSELGASLTQEIRGVTGNPIYNLGQQALDKASGALAWYMATAEEYNRQALFLAAVRAYRVRGLKEEQARKEALDLVGRAHFWYGKENRAEVVRGVGSIPYQFRQWQHNYWTWVFEQMADAARGDAAAMGALGRNLGVTLALGGLTGAGMGGAISAAFRAIFERDPEEELARYSRLVARLLFRGGFGAMGLDISGSLNPSELPFDWKRASRSKSDFGAELARLLIGVSWQWFSRAYDVQKDLHRGQKLRALEDAAPNFLRNILAAARLAAGVRDRSGRPQLDIDPKTGRLRPLRLTPPELIGKALGFQPTRLNEAANRSEFAAQRDRARQQTVRDFADRLQAAYEAKDSAARKQILEEIRAYNRRLRERGQKEDLITARALRAALAAKRRPAVPGGSAARYLARFGKAPELHE